MYKNWKYSMKVKDIKHVKLFTDSCLECHFITYKSMIQLRWSGKWKNIEWEYKIRYMMKSPGDSHVLYTMQSHHSALIEEKMSQKQRLRVRNQVNEITYWLRQRKHFNTQNTRQIEVVWEVETWNIQWVEEIKYIINSWI